jgi:mannose-6-phosphate isomerase
MSSPSPSAAIDFSRPVCLRPDNFTPLARTPWAGETIARLYKQDLVPESRGNKIGESWEFSCDPAFPSRLRDVSVTLPQLLKEQPEKILGNGRSCEILVKLLNAGEPLSLQVHPRDDDPDLNPGECGKPESWYILHAEPGAGLYLGFSRAVSREELRAALQDGDRGRQLLQFVPVRPGDYFEIEPGVPHCIGPGVTLLEPQRIVEGRTGKTFRLWDFGRRYDGRGQVDMVHGSPRELHLDAGLKLIDPVHQTGAAWVSSLRRVPRKLTPVPGVTLSLFPANNWYRTLIIDAEARADVPLALKGGYASLTVLSGSFAAAGVNMQAGQSALLPAAALPLTLNTNPGSKAALVFPAYCEFGA